MDGASKGCASSVNYESRQCGNKKTFEVEVFMVKTITAALSCLLVTVFVWGAAPAKSFAETKIGYVDLQKCLMQSIKGKKAFEELKAKKEKMQKDLDKRQTNLDQMKASLEKQGMMLSPEAKRAKEKDFQRKLRDFKDMYNDFTEEMKIQEEKKKQIIFKDLSKIIETVGKKGGYALILEKNTSGILWAPDNADLTDVVIKAYDEEVSKKTK
jgi:outer membrane protein